MGNQNKTPRSRIKWTNLSSEGNRYHEKQVIDLDEIVEQWIWSMWNRAKTKSLSHYKREELVIKINWKQIVFTQSDPDLCGSFRRSPQSRILFRTKFNNNTPTEQSYLFKTERFTSSIFQFSLHNRLIKSQESSIIFRLPEQIAEVGGIQRKQSVEVGQHNTIKEYSMRWNVNSEICVAPYTHTCAELNIDEEEYSADFSLYLRFSGRITATIATRQSPNTYLRFFDGDIVQIIREAKENNHRLSVLEILEENPPVVRFAIHGECSFRYGIEQHVVLNKEALDGSSSSTVTENHPVTSTPFDYRPLRIRVPSLNHPIHLKINDDDEIL